MTQISLRTPGADSAERLVPVPVIPVSSGALLRRDRHSKTQVVLIDECPLRRTCTLHLLRAHKFKTAQPFSHASELFARVSIKAERPSVVIISVGVRSVTEAPLREQLRTLGSHLTSTPVIVMSDLEESEEMVAAFREGARGYIPTSLDPRLVIEAIRMVVADVMFGPVETLMRLRRQTQHKVEQPCIEQVTGKSSRQEEWPPQQLAVLRLLVQGSRNKDIARALALEESTIKVHVRIIMRKLGVTNRTQAALSVRRLGIRVALDGAPVSIMAGLSRAPAAAYSA
jgi:DNA-binding NarL/FixJ family response regulator